MKWNQATLSELTTLIKRGVSPKYVSELGVPIINQRCIRNNTINFDLARLSSKAKKITEVKFLRVGDTLVNSTGVGTLGRTAYVARLNEPTSADTHVTIVRPDKSKVNEKYLSLYINSKEDIIENMGKGATGQTELSASDLAQLKVLYPESIESQKQIADILSDYDNLIENNLKRIALLEQAAQNIYKEWFVHMRFPGHEDTTIDQVTGIPDDWRFGYVSEFGSVITGKTPSKKKVEYYGGDIPFIKTPDMHNAPYVIESKEKLTQQGADSQSNKTLPKNTVMVSCIGTAGVVAITSTLSQTNQQINSVVFDTDFKTFYFYCFAKGLKDLLNGLGSNGATMVNVNKGKFENIQLLIPSDNSLKRFNTIVKPIFSQILTLLEMNKKLIMSRDILLPRLMNQTIKV